MLNAFYTDLKRPREQSPSILPQVVHKHNPKSAATGQHKKQDINVEKDNITRCLECINHQSEDKRNYYFCQLLNEEFMYIKPCIRSRCYIKMLNFVQHAKNAHFNEIDLSDTEKQ